MRKGISHRAGPLDPRTGIRAFLLLDVVVRLFLWAASFALATGSLTALGAWPEPGIVRAGLAAAWAWGLALINWIALFNLFYVLLLIVCRLPIPSPKEGRYTMQPGSAPDRNLVWSCLVATLTKARYEAPFPAFLVHQVSSLPPMSWAFNAVVGPKSRSANVTQPIFADPYIIEVGRNVVFGYGAVISGHVQGRDEIVIKKTIIEDDVMIGGNVLVYCGCRIRRGAVILGGAIVPPDTEVGENEVWGGVPAKRIRALPPFGSEPVTHGEAAAPAEIGTV